MLDGKVIYVVTTGANKSKDVKILLDYLKAEGATCIVMPTPTSSLIMDPKSVEGYQIKRDFTFNRADSINERIPEEDAIVVAPCTFNTFSKIAFLLAFHIKYSPFKLSILVNTSTNK